MQAFRRAWPNNSLSRAPAEIPVDRPPTGRSDRPASHRHQEPSHCSCSQSCLIMRQNTPVFGGNRKSANPCAIQLKSHTNRQLPSSQRRSTTPVFQLVCNKFPVIGYRPFADWFGETASTTRKSAQIGVISSSVEWHDISEAWASMACRRRTYAISIRVPLPPV